MFREYVSAGEPGAILHEFEKRVFTIRADLGYVSQIDDELPTLQLLSRASPGALYFCGPGKNQLAFEDESPLSGSFNDGDPEHCLAARKESNAIANRRIAGNVAK